MSLRVGIDIGSTTVKVVLLDEQNKLLFRSYERHYSKTRERACQTLRALAGRLSGQAIKLVITGATFLDKNAAPVHVDLTTGAHDPMPFDGRIDSIEQNGTEWELHIVSREPAGRHGGLFSWEYTAPDGTKDTSGHMGYSPGDNGFGTQFLYVDNYDFDEVWLTLNRTDEWTPATPLMVEIQTK